MASGTQRPAALSGVVCVRCTRVGISAADLCEPCLLEIPFVAEFIDWLLSNAAAPAFIFLIALVERYIPVLPSYATFAIIGVATSQTDQSLAFALAIAWAGSAGGAVPWYVLGAALGPERSKRFLMRILPYLGLKPAKAEQWLALVDGKGPVLLGVSQLIPTVRLITPLLAGMLGVSARKAAIPTALGIMGWLMIFVFGGWLASETGITDDPWEIAAGLAIGVLVIEVGSLVVWRLSVVLKRRRRGPATPEPQADEA